MKYRETLKIFHDLDPLLERIIEPRRYRENDRWLTTKTHAFSVFFSLNSLLMSERKAELFSENLRDVFIGAAIQSSYQFPFFFVERDLLEAVKLTEPDPGLRWDALLMPYEGLTFLFPPGSLTHPTLGNCDMISLARCPHTNHLDAPLCRELSKRSAGRFRDHQFRSTASTFITWTVAYENSESPVLSQTMNNNETPFISDEVLEDASDPRLKAEFDAPLMTDEDNQFLTLITQLAFRLLLAMQARPALLETGARNGIHKKSGQEIWQPNILGRNYRSLVRRPHLGGEHTSPRFHFRRGHFRQQRYGRELAESKIIWIEPTSVGAKNELLAAAG